MPKRDKLFQDMAQDDSQAVLLVAQVGGMPGEIQLILETATLDDAADQLRPLNNYIIRVLGAAEHHVVDLGTTVDRVALLDDHPLLYQYNARPVALFFRGQPQNVDELIIDISQAHASTFGPWRNFPQYINLAQPLFTLLGAGGGLLGQMPQPLADRLIPVLEKHGLEHNAMAGKTDQEQHDNPVLQQQKAKVLLIGRSYFIANMFSFEEMGRT